MGTRNQPTPVIVPQPSPPLHILRLTAIVARCGAHGRVRCHRPMKSFDGSSGANFRWSWIYEAAHCFELVSVPR
jgi:hypothetical protein